MEAVEALVWRLSRPLYGGCFSSLVWRLSRPLYGGYTEVVQRLKRSQHSFQSLLIFHPFFQLSKVLAQLLFVHRRQSQEVVEVRTLYRKEAMQRKLLFNEVGVVHSHQAPPTTIHMTSSPCDNHVMVWECGRFSTQAPPTIVT